ncbi:MAG: hypothetical protein ACK5WP_02575, partial [Neisseriaceae bacterium]
LTFTIKDPNFATITESGIISAKSSAIGESTSLNIKLNKNISLNNIPVLKHNATLDSNIIIYANESSVSPINLPQNFHVKLSATGTFDDGKTRDISAYTGLWSSTDNNIAFESDSIFGITLFSKNAGPTTIHAIGGINVESSISVHVFNSQLNSMSIYPNNTIIPFGSNIHMKAIGNFTGVDITPFDIDMTNNVTWSVESSVIANINDTTGILTTHESGGNIKINAVSKLGKSATANLTISNAMIKSVFITDNVGGVPIESINLVKGISTKIYSYARYSNGKVRSLNLSQTPECKWFIGDTQGQITLAQHDVYAILTARNQGSTSVILSCPIYSLNYSTKVYVNNAVVESIAIDPPEPIRLAQGDQEKLTVSAYYSDGKSINNVEPIIWTSESTGIIEIESDGIIKAKNVGHTIIKAEYDTPNGKHYAFKEIEVISAILKKIVVAAESTIVSGTTEPIYAIGYYSDGESRDISTLVDWDCKSPIQCYKIDNKVIESAESVSTNTNALVRVTENNTGITESISVTVLPVTLIQLIFKEGPQYHCYKPGPRYSYKVACYIEFEAVYNNNPTPVPYPYTRNNFPIGCFDINPTPSYIYPPEPGISSIAFHYNDIFPINVSITVKIGNVTAHKNYEVEN